MPNYSQVWSNSVKKNIMTLFPCKVLFVLPSHLSSNVKVPVKILPIPFLSAQNTTWSLLLCYGLCCISLCIVWLFRCQLPESWDCFTHLQYPKSLMLCWAYNRYSLMLNWFEHVLKTVLNFFKITSDQKGFLDSLPESGHTPPHSHGAEKYLGSHVRRPKVNSRLHQHGESWANYFIGLNVSSAKWEEKGSIYLTALLERQMYQKAFCEV